MIFYQQQKKKLNKERRKKLHLSTPLKIKIAYQKIKRATDTPPPPIPFYVIIYTPLP